MADCHSGSSRVPSRLGGCSIAVACAFRFDCSIFGTCPESGDKKQRYRTIRNRVAGTGLAHDSIVSPLNAIASEAHQVKDEHYLCGNRVADRTLLRSIRRTLSVLHHLCRPTMGCSSCTALAFPMLLSSGCSGNLRCVC